MLTELQASFFSVKEEQGKRKKNNIQDIILFTFSIAYEIIVQVLNKKDRPYIMRTSITY